MELFRPQELKARLAEIGAAPLRALSQNFLIDGNLLAKIVLTASVGPNDLVLEIGPGPGALTQKLLGSGAFVVAVEKDRCFARHLAAVAADDEERKRLVVHEADFLKADITALVKEAKLLYQPQRVVVVANLPYSLTAPIIGRLLENNSLFSELHLLVQKEVAERLTATLPNRNSSVLGVLMQLYGEVQTRFILPATAFWPKPKVESALLSIFFSQAPLLSDDQLEPFSLFIHRAFAQRRKKLQKVLQNSYPKSLLETAWQTCGLNPNARIEELDLKTLLQLFAITHSQNRKTQEIRDQD